LSQANKLSRTYAVLLDALNRHRGKGQQKVTVKHVHVHSGGQAIVGTVETSALEWKSKALRTYQRRTLVADALIAGAYLAGTKTRRGASANPKVSHGSLHHSG
jgi:hypothetical protein